MQRFQEMPTVRATSLRRHSRSSSHPGVHQEADVMVTADGKLRLSPIYAAISRTFEPNTATRWRRHESVEIVCVMVSGQLACEVRHAGSLVLGSEDVAVLKTNAGLEYRWLSIGVEPARALFFWLPARIDRAPRCQQYRAPRTQRLGELVAIAGDGTRAPTTERVRLYSTVLPHATSIVHAAEHRRCYIVPTLGPIAVDGMVASPTAGIVGEGGSRTIHALESTEVLIVEV